MAIKRSEHATKPANTEAKKDALALAQLAFDIFKASKASGNIGNGQNNAQSTQST